MDSWLRIWHASAVLQRAFEEHCDCVREVHLILSQIVRTLPGVHPDYQVRLGALPRGALSLRKNLFSTLFGSVYHALGVGPDRRLLYGRLNQLFRIWVTSADNLLDGEDKAVLPLGMAEGGRVMRDVVAIMAADRAMAVILRMAVAEGVLSADQSQELSTRTLQVLLPSACEEASEEAGVAERASPAHVLGVIHRYKTGLLFEIPFLGPDVLGRVDRDRSGRMKEALVEFGTGCQLLDDIRDMARDLVEQRQNYLLSVLHWEHPETLARLRDADLKPEDRLYHETMAVTTSVAKRGSELTSHGARTLAAAGLGRGPAAPDALAFPCPRACGHRLLAASRSLSSPTQSTKRRPIGSNATLTEQRWTPVSCGASGWWAWAAAGSRQRGSWPRVGRAGRWWSTVSSASPGSP